MMTKAEQNRQLQRIESERIFLYHLNEAKKEIDKGNENIKVLYQLLLKEINQHNGIVTKKYRKARFLPTSD
jgi:septation ring formation regulator EzrA